MKKRKYLIYTLMLIFFLSCAKEEKTLILSSGAEGGTYIEVGKILQTVLEKNTSLKLNLQTGPNCNSPNNCKKLLEGKADLVIAQNDVSIKNFGKNYSGINPIRTILPLYDEVCFIIYKDSLKPKSLYDLMHNRRVCLSAKNSGTEHFALNLLNALGIKETDYIKVNCESKYNYICDSIDVSISLTGFTNSRIRDMLLNKNGLIFSLDNFQLRGNGSSVEGICMNNILWQPFLIPKNTYNAYPEKPILTISVKSVLLANKSLDKNLAYQIVETIIDNQSYLSKKLKILNGITDNLKLTNYNFPFHSGLKMYIERNKPSYLEEHAEFIGLIITILLTLFGGIKSALSWIKRHKKNRIDKYYQIVLNVDENLHTLATIVDYQNEYNRLILLKKEAFKDLIKEKLNADESFRIFTELLNSTLDVLHKKIVTLKKGALNEI